MFNLYLFILIIVGLCEFYLCIKKDTPTWSDLWLVYITAWLPVIFIVFLSKIEFLITINF